MDIREYFEAIPAKVTRARDLRDLLDMSGGIAGRRTDAPRVASCSSADRTAAEAGNSMRRREELSSLMADLREAAAIVAGVRRGLGEAYAAAIFERYLKPPRTARTPTRYADVAARLGISARTAIRRTGIALDWIDANGRARVIEIGKGYHPALATAAQADPWRSSTKRAGMAA